MNQHCGKHDKIFDPAKGETCPGCDTEKLKGPDDTLAEMRGGKKRSGAKAPEE
jgi:hypothetical protein